MEISYLAAFFGGVISLLTPCSAMIIPIFAASLTNKKTNPIHTILMFSMGLIVSLLPLAIGATLLNQIFFAYRQPISLLIGILFQFFGVITLFGYQFKMPEISSKISSNKFITQFGTAFTLGLIAGLGATACIGPILGAVISLGAVSTNHLSGILHMLAYAFGLIFPLLLFTLLYIRHQDSQVKFIHTHTLSMLGRKVPLSQVLAGLLLIFISLLFIFHQGSLAVIPYINHSKLLDQIFDLQQKLFLIQ